MRGMCRRAAVPDRVGGTCSKVHVIRYADDSMVTAASWKLLVERVIPAVEAFLAGRGLRLSPEKSKITHIGQGAFCTKFPRHHRASRMAQVDLTGSAN